MGPGWSEYRNGTKKEAKGAKSGGKGQSTGEELPDMGMRVVAGAGFSSSEESTKGWLYYIIYTPPEKEERKERVDMHN